LLKVTFAHLFWVTKFAASGAGATQVVFEGRVSRPGTGQAPQSLLQLEQVSPVSQVPLPQVAQMPPSLAQGVQLFPPQPRAKRSKKGTTGRGTRWDIEVSSRYLETSAATIAGWRQRLRGVDLPRLINDTTRSVEP
jgi:hypothetical protein